jgi:hypothetical protein
MYFETRLVTATQRREDAEDFEFDLALGTIRSLHRRVRCHDLVLFLRVKRATAPVDGTSSLQERSDSDQVSKPQRKAEEGE